MNDIKMTRAPLVMNMATVSITEAMARIRQLEAELEDLQHRLATASYTLSICQGQRLIRIASHDIAYLQAESNYSHIQLLNGLRYCTSRTLKSWAGELEGGAFIRCHRSFLVNRQAILEIDPHQQCITLKTGERIPTSRRMSRSSMQMMLRPETLHLNSSETHDEHIVRNLHRSVA